MSKLYFLRHQKTVLNDSGRISGQEDSEIVDSACDISQLGRCVGPKLRIYTSPAERCLKTVERLALMIGSSIVEIDCRLVERDLGYFQGKLRSEMVAQYGNFFCNGRFIIKMTPPGGESFEDFEKRIKSFAAEIPSKLSDSDVLICSHNQTMKLIYFNLTGKSIEKEWYSVDFPNGKVIRAI